MNNPILLMPLLVRYLSGHRVRVRDQQAGRGVYPVLVNDGYLCVSDNAQNVAFGEMCIFWDRLGQDGLRVKAHHPIHSLRERRSSYTSPIVIPLDPDELTDRVFVGSTSTKRSIPNTFSIFLISVSVGRFPFSVR